MKSFIGIKNQSLDIIQTKMLCRFCCILLFDIRSNLKVNRGIEYKNESKRAVQPVNCGSIETLKFEKVFAKGKLLFDNGKALFKDITNEILSIVNMAKRKRLLTTKRIGKLPLLLYPLKH